MNPLDLPAAHSMMAELGAEPENAVRLEDNASLARPQTTDNRSPARIERFLIATSLTVALLGPGCTTPSATKLASAPTPPSSASSEDRRVLVDFVRSLFETRYAPRVYKAETLGWDLSAELARLEALAAEDVPLADFQRGLHLFFRSPKDNHTSVSFERSRAVWLGIAIRRTSSGYHIAWLDESLHGPTALGLRVGAEVIAWNGSPVHDVVEAATEQTGWDSTPLFRQRFAEWFTVFRLEREWDVLPEPGTKVTLTVRDGGAPRQVDLTWRDVAEEPEPFPTRRCPLWGKSAGSYLPPLGTVSWRNDSELVPGYAFESEGRTYGYIRIARYRADREDVPRFLADFDATIDELQRRGAEGVVLDQLGNSGGNFVFGFTMLARLAQASLRPPIQRFQTDESGAIVAYPHLEDYREYLRTLELADGEDVRAAFDRHPLLTGPLAFLPRDAETLAELKGFLRLISDPQTTKAGLTPPHHQVVRHYRLDPTRRAPYRGPVLVLIDEFNLSAAEYVAAGLADSGRARLFGATTSGAGGDQRWYTTKNLCGDEKLTGTTQCTPPRVARAMKALGVSGVAITVTLGYRSDEDGAAAKPIENVGIRPDFPYALTREDLLQGFAPMRSAILDALRSMTAREP